MGPARARLLILLERRLSALQQLARGIRESETALGKLNLEGVHQCATHQENLCAEIRFLDRELEGVREILSPAAGPDRARDVLSELAANLDPDAAKHLPELLNELAVAEAEVRRLNRIQASLLQRSRRSVNVMMNFLANFSATYQPPRAGGALPAPTMVRH